MDLKAYDERRDRAHEVLSISALKSVIELHKKTSEIPTINDVKRELGFSAEEAYFLDSYAHNAIVILLAEIIESRSSSD